MKGCTCRGLTLCPQCERLAQRAGVLVPGTPPALTEKVFQAAVVRIAREAGYMIYHTFDSRKSPCGYPDVTLVHPTRQEMPVFLCELKTATGQVTPAQQAWVDALDSRTTVATVWRPDALGMIRRWLTADGGH